MVLRLRIPAPNWDNGARCAEEYPVTRREDYDPWFKDEPVALSICNRDEGCPLREECLIFALTNNLKDGVYGGTTPVQRRWLRRKWPLRRGKEPRPEWGFGLAPGDEECLADMGKTREELEAEDDEDCEADREDGRGGEDPPEPGSAAAPA